jgi:cytosine/adenosine deaminase-related metal-dependent hydrolase
MTTAPPAVVAPRSGRDGRWLVDGVVGGQDADGRPITGPAELVVRSGIIERLAPLYGSGPAPGGMQDGEQASKSEQDGPGRTGLVLLPLFVNAHDHGRGTGNVAAGIADGPLEEWLVSLQKHPKSTQEALVGHGCALMVASGVGASVICVNPQGADRGPEVAAAAEAALDRGMRAAIVYPIADTMGTGAGRSRQATGWDAGEIDRRLNEVEEIAANYDDPSIEVQLGPVGPQWVSEATLQAVGQHAALTGRRVHMHLLESRAQRAWADTTYPEGIVNFLDSVGLIGPSVCFAHGTQLRPEELGALAERGCVLALNASSNMRLCSGLAPVALARQAGVHLGAGLDGLALRDDGDYWTELRLLRGLEQAQTGRVTEASAFIGTLAAGGRIALGGAAPLPPAPGRTADFLLLDIEGYSHLLAEGSWTAADVALAIGRPQRVAEVWVAGRPAYARSRSGGTSEATDDF